MIDPLPLLAPDLDSVSVHDEATEGAAGTGVQLVARLAAGLTLVNIELHHKVDMTLEAFKTRSMINLVSSGHSVRPHVFSTVVAGSCKIPCELKKPLRNIGTHFLFEV